MPEYVIVRVNDKLIPEFQINFDPLNAIAKHSNISAWEQIDIQNKQELILILSANLVLNTHISIPSKNEEVIRQSIPFALEEQLADNIEKSHFSYTKVADQLFLVSIVNKNILASINQSLQNHGLKCLKLFSEIFTVPMQTGSTSICEMDKYFIVNNNFSGSTMHKGLLEQYLQLTESKNTIIYGDKQSDLSERAAISFKRLNTSLLQAKTITSGQVVNLFQGDFAQDADNNKSINPWKKIITLAAVLVVSWLIINVYHLWTLQADIDQTREKQKALLLKLIPNANQTEINNPFAAIQSQLKHSQNINASNAGGFIQSLNFLGQTLIEHPQIQVESLRQRNTKLEIKLQAQNVALINSFQAGLEKNILSMRVKTGTRDTNSNGVSSIITMEHL